MFKTSTALTAGLCLFAAAATHAQSIQVNQPDMVGGVTVFAADPVGQSFTALGDRIGSIDLMLQNANVHTPDLLADRFVTVRLLDGVGFGGSLLGTSTVDVAAQLGDGHFWNSTLWSRFDFGSLAVTPGHSYTFQVQVSTPRFSVGYTDLDAYAGGTMFSRSLPGVQATDMTFRIAAPVPEPASLALFSLGLAGLAVWRRRAA